MTIIVRNETGDTLKSGDCLCVVCRPRRWWNPMTWFGCKYVATRILYGLHLEAQEEEPSCLTAR